MLISSDILRRELQENLSVTVFGNISGELSLSKVLFAEDDNPFEDGAIYIMSEAAKRVPLLKKIQSVLIIIGNYEVEFIRDFEAVFIIDDSETIFNIYNKVQNAISYYKDWSNELRQELHSGSNVQAMIDIGTRILDNPLVLQDRNFTPIAVSSIYAESPFLDPILDDNNIPYLMQTDMLSEDNTFEKTSTVIPLQITGRHALYINLFQQGRFQYRLLMLQMNSEVFPSTPYLIEYLSTFIQLAIGFVVDESKESKTLSYVMKGILSGEYNDLGFIEERLSDFGWEKEHEYVCLKVHADLPDYKNRTLRFMSDRLKLIFADACIFEYENSIAIFYNLEMSEQILPGIESEIAMFLQDNNMRAGISNTFSGFAYFKQYYTQAGVALKLGPTIKPYQWLHRFSEVKEQYILESCTDKLPARMICEPGLLKLREYDKKHKQDLYNTLYVYLKNNMRSVNAAKELFIHRSTFLYRLDRIKEIMGSDIDPANDQWYLLLSYKLLEKKQKI